MNRRDLLKQTGALALGLPALSTSGLGKSILQPAVKDLIVSFSGPFCYWAEEGSFKVMAPPVGRNFAPSRHQAWIATSTNETTLNSELLSTPPEYQLEIPVSGKNPQQNGTPAFMYGQEGPPANNQLFNLKAPNPDQIIGVRPTKVQIEDQKTKRQSVDQILAASLTFLYKNVDVTQVRLTLPGKASNPASWSFQPCFTNDASLPVAILGIHLSQVNQHPDTGHQQAYEVWAQMLKMYPWMDVKIHFPGFDPAQCPDSPPQSAKSSSRKPGMPETGPGNDCEVPIMLLVGGESKGTRPRK